MELTQGVGPNERSCIELQPSDLEAAGLPSEGLYPQLARFSYWTSPVTNPWCPQSELRVRYASNDREALNDAIDGFTSLSDGTGTHYAMKYALDLLEPSSNGDCNALRGAGLLGSDFVDRPLPHGSSQKYIVLMTDGGVSDEYRPNDVYEPTLETERLNLDSSKVFRSRNRNASFDLFQDVCSLAKHEDRDVIVYTIAMDSSTAEDQLRDCASSPSHFFAVSSGDIEEVFEAIARSLTRDVLGLTN